MTATLDAYAPAVPIGADGRAIAIYTRRSKDPRTGRLGEAVEWQEQQVRDAFITPELAPRVRVFSDNDISASRYSRKARKDYARMMEEIAAGQIGAVLFTAQDRLIRQPRELEDLMTLVDLHRVTVRGVVAGHLDFESATGRLGARMGGVVAAHESDVKSERQRGMHEKLANKGRFSGGKRRFGYSADMTEIREDEAAYIRELADRVLAGETLTAIARDFNSRGSRTAAGVEWTHGKLRSMILGAHHAALRTHRGEIVGEAEWTATLPRETWQAVKSVLMDPARGVGQKRTRRYLLTGIAVCGECGRTVRGRVVRVKNGGTYPAYICSSTAHVQKPVEYTDLIVSAEIGERLASVASELLATGDTGDASRLADEADALRAHRDELARSLATPGADIAAFRIAAAAIDDRLAEITRAMGEAVRVPAVLAGLAGNPDARAKFDALPLDRQRAVLAEMPGRVVLNPNPKRGMPFDPATVTVDWEDAPTG
jgi:DNA invertase Pin-like site-specific DNA recombinase